MPNQNRSLWRVYVVDPRGSGKVLMDGAKPVVAVTEGEAQLKAGVGQVAAEAGLDIEQVDIYCEKIAEFVRPRRETQKVVLAKDDDKD
jgi:hypothetical protein